ncbi:MAG TPA: TetR/AcrR family transcriptional regulator [Clostridia bacterium]|nr:TetR/AcrR family transcriptional regulator [Clostridia bacterium]
MSKRQEQKTQTKKLIVNIAINQFAKDGLLTTRTSDIATSANLSHGSIFAHFPTREALLEAAIEEFGMRVTNKLHESIEENCEMEGLLMAHLKGIQEHELFYSRLISEASLLPESARNTLIGIQSAISFHLIQVAEREMSASRILRMPVNLMFNTWIGLINYYIMNRDIFAPGESVISRYGQQLINHYMKLISFRDKEVN